MFNLQGESVSVRLRKAFLKVCLILGLGSITGIVAMFIISTFYDKVLVNYAFPQGDLGMAMVLITESHDNLASAIGFTDAEDIADAKESYSFNRKQFEHYVGVIESTIVTPEGSEAFNKIKSLSTDYWKAADSLMEECVNLTDAKRLELEHKLIESTTPKYEEARAAIYELMEVNVVKGDDSARILIIIKWIAGMLISATLFISITYSIRLGKVTAHQITNTLDELGNRLSLFCKGDLTSEFPDCQFDDEVTDIVLMSETMAKDLTTIIKDIDFCLTSLAEGDFTVKTKCESKYSGEFVSILNSMRDLKERLRVTLTSINEASEQVSEGSAQLASSAQSIAEGASEQAGAVQELTATIESVAVIAQTSAESSADSAESIKEAVITAGKGRADMESLVTAMQLITETSKEIEGIIVDIEGIASQTNLLSLNANIEAARAGEAGRGFAVVADQIGKLANDSAQSASNTKTLISKSLSEIAKGNQMVESAMTSISSILLSMEKFADIAITTAQSSKEQADMLNQIENGIEQIASVVQDNSATSEETSAISEELSAQATQLQEMISKFRLR